MRRDSALSRVTNMKRNKLGFTLIELLVVVLIIGVLAAVALPQYQKAVRKSRFTALMPIAKTLASANEAYYLGHGTYALTPTDLPVEGQSDYPDGTSIDLVNNENYNYTIVYNANTLPDNNYVVFQKQSTRFADTTMCEARNDTAAEVCRALGGTELGGGVTNGFTAYLLSGDAGSGFVTTLTPSGTNVPCPAPDRTGTCTVYTLEDSSVLEIREIEPGIIDACKLDADSNCIFGGVYDVNNNFSFVEGNDWEQKRGLCELYPTLDICNN